MVRRFAMASVVTMSVAACLCPAYATGSPRPQIVDVAGDANAINNQQQPSLTVPETQTPYEVSAADILNVRFRTTHAVRAGRSVVSGSTVTMTLAAPPQRFTLYRVDFLSASCPGNRIDLMYGDVPASFGLNDVVCENRPGIARPYDVPPAIVRGSTISWTLPVSQFPVGAVFSGLAAETGLDSGAAYVPYFDLARSHASFVVGG